jgi:hypothetical protein
VRPDVLTSVLTAAGFTTLDVIGVREPVTTAPTPTMRVLPYSSCTWRKNWSPIWMPHPPRQERHIAELRSRRHRQ